MRPLATAIALHDADGQAEGLRIRAKALTWRKNKGVRHELTNTNLRSIGH
jgi:hypothetical protein